MNNYLLTHGKSLNSSNTVITTSNNPILSKDDLIHTLKSTLIDHFKKKYKNSSILKNYFQIYLENLLTDKEVQSYILKTGSSALNSVKSMISNGDNLADIKKLLKGSSGKTSCHSRHN